MEERGFTVDDVVLDGWIYDPGANVETSDSISPPLPAPALATECSNGLGNAYPSPGNPNIWIPFTLADARHVVIKIHDMSGRLIRTLDIGHISAGFYTTKEKAAYWDGRNGAGEEVSSGVYFYTIQAGDFTATRKLVIAR